jgi:predicted kinase
MLIIFGGLPGTGKTTVARKLARRIGAVHLRIDSIEQAILGPARDNRSLDDTGYRVAYAIAEDKLLIGRKVIADSVNPLAATRNAWVEIAHRVGVLAVEIEVTCSDAGEHRHRVEQRRSDIVGLKLPSWADVVSGEYHLWDREHIVIDTSRKSVEENIQILRETLWA